jgi:hypothetical protein
MIFGPGFLPWLGPVAAFLALLGGQVGEVASRVADLR